MNQSTHGTTHKASQKRLFGLYGLLATFGAVLSAMCLWFAVWHNLNQAKEEFATLAFHVSESLQQSLVVKETVLDGFAAFLAQVGMQDPRHVRRYSQAMMKRYDDLYMFQAAHRVSQSEVTSFEKMMTKRRNQSISVRQFDFERGLVSAEQSPSLFYYPLVFVEPRQNNGFEMLGLDIASIPFVAAAMDASSDSGMVSMSEGFELPDGDYAFVMIKPSLLQVGDDAKRYALLVVKAQTLLQGIELNHSGMALEVRYENLVPIMQTSTAPLSPLEVFLFPNAQLEKSFILGEGRIFLTLKQQLGFQHIQLLTLIIIILICLGIGLAINQLLHRHYQDEQSKIKDNQKLYERANYDRLTGLANRHYFEDYFTRSVAGCRRRADKIGILYVDLNDFKQINDNFGHATGDRVLQLTGAILLDCVRADDVACRYGGDEFVILLERVITPEDAQKVIFRIHEEMAQVQYVEGHVVRLSASIGFAMYPDDGETLEALLHGADRKMYAAKRQAKVLSMEEHNKLKR